MTGPQQMPGHSDLLGTLQRSQPFNKDATVFNFFGPKSLGNSSCFTVSLHHRVLPASPSSSAAPFLSPALG